MIRLLSLTLACLLAACSPAQQAAVNTAIANGQASAVSFCKTDQPVVGTLATVSATTVGALIPAAAPAGPVTGLIVADVNGACARLLAQPVAAPAPGAVVVVPAS